MIIYNLYMTTHTHRGIYSIHFLTVLNILSVVLTTKFQLSKYACSLRHPQLGGKCALQGEEGMSAVNLTPACVLLRW